MKVVCLTEKWMGHTEMNPKSTEFDEAIWSLGVLALLGFLAFWLFLFSSPIRLALLLFIFSTFFS